MKSDAPTSVSAVSVVMAMAKTKVILHHYLGSANDVRKQEKQQIKFNKDTLEFINNTLPNNVSFKIEKSSTTNKFIDPLIRA